MQGITLFQILIKSHFDYFTRMLTLLPVCFNKCAPSPYVTVKRKRHFPKRETTSGPDPKTRSASFYLETSNHYDPEFDNTTINGALHSVNILALRFLDPIFDFKGLVD